MNKFYLLASYLFETPLVLADPNRPRSKGPDGTVDLEEHAGVDAELEAVADWVSRQIVNGIPLEEIAVLVPTLDPFVGLVADRLASLPWHDGSFPVHVAEGLPFTHYAAGARVLAVVRALRGHLAADLMGELLPALRLAGETERHLARGAAMDLLWSLGTVGGNSAQPRGALEWSNRAAERQIDLERQIQESEAAAKKGDEDREFIVRQTKRRVADLKVLRPALDALTTIARSAVQKAPLSALWPMLQEFFAERLLQPSLVRHTVLNESLETLASDPTCGSLTGDEALKVVEDTIVSTRIPLGRFGDPALYVGTVRGATGLRFSAVRVIALTEGHLPSLPREDPVISNALRQTMKSRAGELSLPLPADRALEDLHWLDLVIRNAERFVALSAPRQDAERSEREPSSVILEAAAALARPNRVTGERGSVIPDRVALTRDAFIPAREEASHFRLALPLTETAWQDGVATNAVGLPSRWREVATLDLQRIEDLRGDLGAGPMDGMLGRLAAEFPMPGLSADYPISASSIVQLLSCPYAFLLNRLLYFKEPSEAPPQREIGQPYYGSLFHEVAAKFYSDNGAEFCAHKKSLSDWQKVADRLVESVFQEFLKKYPLVGHGVRAQQERKLKDDVRHLLEYDWDRLKGVQITTEKSFGQPVPVQVRIGAKVLYLHGRIDRIEIAGTKAVIRDLKTGRAYPRIGEGADPDPGLDIQIGVYGLVAELLSKEWKLPKQIETGYAYFGRPSGERLFGEDYRAVLKPAATKWLEIAAGLLMERQFPRTPNSDDCSYCSFQPVCGDGAYSRSKLLLGSSAGAVADFAGLKMPSDDES